MRLQRLDIAGFGRLRDLSIGFGARITVILGENETGKTTIQRAVRAALYGIDCGGQGRPVDRSDWQRWAPWDGGSYGLALTYRLADGRRLRVAHRLDSREHAAQVQELGGADITPTMRVGRLVAPGNVHLGIEEGVFCATACLGEGGLRLGAPDGATAQSDRIQEAIERLADSSDGATTAAAAIGRLRDALDRVGSERRANSPLGVATGTMRRLDAALDVARRRVDGVRREQDRLAELEAKAEMAETRRQECERAWLLGRLADLQRQRRELDDSEAEAERLEKLVGVTTDRAAFPIDLEERLISLTTERHQADQEAGNARQRQRETADDLIATRARRRAIAAALEPLRGATATVSASALSQARALEEEVHAEGSARRRRDRIDAAVSRRQALQREIADTGLGAIDVGTVDATAPLIEAASRAAGADRRAMVNGAATAFSAAVLGLVLRDQGHAGVAAMVWIAGALGTVLAVVLARARVGNASQARRRLARQCPGLDLSPGGLARATSRLEDVRELHIELLRQEGLLDSLRSEEAAARERVSAVAARAEQLARACGLRPPPPDHAVDPTERATMAIRSIIDADTTSHRRRQLIDEDARLAGHESALDAVEREAQRRDEQLRAVEGAIARLLADGDIPTDDLERGITAFRAACAARRDHDTAADRLAAARRRIATLGHDRPSIDQLIDQFAAELRSRDGDPADATDAEPLDAARLRALENEVEQTRRAAENARAEALTLRSRLNGVLDGLPSIADLEDERSAAAAARDRAVQQVTALRRAIDLVEEATRAVHRDLAPRLADAVAGRLSLLTEGRYSAVNVDHNHLTVSLQGNERPELVPLDQVSHGTRDQVSLLLRIAIAEVLSDTGEPVPLFLDEPLLSADPLRRDATLDFLATLSEHTQVVITTTDPEMARSLCNRVVEGATLVEMAPVRPVIPVAGRAVAAE